MNHHLQVHALNIVDATRYLTLGTVDAEGNPWTSPVYMAASGLREFFWQSATDAVHSRNLSAHSRVSLAVFDSTVAPYHGRAVYAVGEAGVVEGEDLEQALQVYPRAAERSGEPLRREELTGDSPYRLYGAVVSQAWVLCPRPPRQPCPLHDLDRDHRVELELPVPIADRK